MAMEASETLSCLSSGSENIPLGSYRNDCSQYSTMGTI